MRRRRRTRRERKREQQRSFDSTPASGVEDSALRVSGPAALRAEGPSALRELQDPLFERNQDPATQQNQADAALTNGAKVLVLDPVLGYQDPRELAAEYDDAPHKSTLAQVATLLGELSDEAAGQPRWYGRPATKSAGRHVP